MGRSTGALYGSDLTDWVKGIQDDIQSKKSDESDSPQTL